jgi:hypothetical protein
MAISNNTLKLLDIGVKGVFGTMVTLIVAVYGLRLQQLSEAHTQAAQKSQEVVNLEAQQKDLDVKIAEDMFQALSKAYFTGPESPSANGDIQRRLLLLHLVALNFQDVPIQLRPLFEDLDAQLKRPEERQALRAIAQDVARRQAFRLTLGGIYNSGPLQVTPGMQIPITELDPTTFVVIDSVSRDSVRAHIKSGLALAGEVGPFDVGYFDWPITDNTKLGDYRLSITLAGDGDGPAKIRIIVFDSHLAPDRFDIKELGRQLYENVHS